MSTPLNDLYKQGLNGTRSAWENSEISRYNQAQSNQPLNMIQTSQAAYMGAMMALSQMDFKPGKQA